MKAVTIPGGTAHFREKHELKIRHRQAIEAATLEALPALAKLPTDDPKKLQKLNMLELGLTAAEARSVYGLESALIVSTIIDWTRPEPIPTLETVGDLDIDVYEGLRAAIPELGVLVGSDVDFDPPNPDSPEFALSPTQPSGDSASASREDQAPASTDTPTRSTESTASVESSQA